MSNLILGKYFHKPRFLSRFSNASVLFPASLRGSILKCVRTIKSDIKEPRGIRLFRAAATALYRIVSFVYGSEFRVPRTSTNDAASLSNVKVPIKIDCARWNGIYFAFDEITAAERPLECQIAVGWHSDRDRGILTRLYGRLQSCSDSCDSYFSSSPFSLPPPSPRSFCNRFPLLSQQPDCRYLSSCTSAVKPVTKFCQSVRPSTDHFADRSDRQKDLRAQSCSRYPPLSSVGFRNSGALHDI